MTRLVTACAAALLVALPACRRAPPPASPPSSSASPPAAPAPSSAPPSAASAPSSAPPAAAVEAPGEGAVRSGLARPHSHDPMVYVDGQARAALVYLELPAVKLRPIAGAYHVGVCDYLRALRVDCARVRRIDWYGGPGQVLSTSRAALRGSKRLTFSFRADEAGVAHMDWASAPAISDVAIYVDMPPPRWEAARAAFIDEGGKAFIGIPYNHDDGRRGTRINLDGLLVARIKRNLLEGNVEPVQAAPPGEAARYRLSDFLTSRSVPLPPLRAVELLSRGGKVERFFGVGVDKIEFTASKKHHGEMTFHLAGHDVAALAVNLWAKSAPRPERVVPGARPEERAKRPAVQARR